MPYYEDYYEGDGRHVQYDDELHRKRRLAYKKKRLAANKTYTGNIRKPASQKKAPVKKKPAPKKRSGSKTATKRKTATKTVARKPRGQPAKKGTRPPSRYNLFVRAFMKDYKRNHPNTELSAAERMVKAARAWRHYTGKARPADAKPVVKFIKKRNLEEYPHGHRYGRDRTTKKWAAERIAMGFGY